MGAETARGVTSAGFIFENSGRELQPRALVLHGARDGILINDFPAKLQSGSSVRLVGYMGNGKPLREQI